MRPFPLFRLVLWAACALAGETLRAQVIDPATGLPTTGGVPGTAPGANAAQGVFTDVDGTETPADSLPDNSVEFDLSDAFIQWSRAGDPFSWRALDTGVYRFQDVDPAFRGTVDRQTLGNLGQASQPLLFGARGTVGFDLAAFDPWTPYTTAPDSLRFWRSNKPYTQARYQLGSGVAQQLALRHVRNLTPNLNVSLDYHRTVSVGQSSRQKAGVHDLGLTAWFRARDRRYSAQLGYVFHDVEAQENGGAAVDSVFDFTPRLGAPVRLDEAQHTQRGQTVFLEQSWYLGRREGSASREAPVPTAPPDSLAADSTYLPPPPPAAPARRPPIRPAWRAWHRLAWSSDRRAFLDADPDSAYYPALDPALIGSPDTLEVAYGFTRLENTFGFGTFGSDRADTLPAWTAEARGIHRYERVQRTAGFFTRQDALLDVRVGHRPGAGRGGWLFDGHARVNARGEYGLRAETGVRAGAQRLTLGLESTRRQPADQEVFFLSRGGRLWENDFGAETRLVPELRYRQTAWGRTDLRLRYHQVLDYLYWDASGRPAQASGGLSVWQAVLRQDFRFGAFRWDNTVALQRSPSANVDLPAYWGRHSLYFAGRLFDDALYAHAGLDLRYNTDYTANAWSPVPAAFHLQTGETLRFYPVADLFFAAYVSRARFVLKGYNLTQGLLRPGWYQTPDYPMFDRGILLQIDWVFWY